MSKASEFKQQSIEVLSATILNGQSDSEIIDLFGTSPSRLYIPASFNGTAITFNSSFDGINFCPMGDGLGAALTVIVSPNISVALDPKQFYSVRYMKLTSNAAETGDKTITVIPYSI